MARKKEENFLELEQEAWDKKKVIAGVVAGLMLLGGGIAAKQLLLPQSVQKVIPHKSAVQGAETQANSNSFIDTATVTPTPTAALSIPTKEDVQKKIQELQQQLTHISVQDIASSSPQIQQIIQQIQALPQAPANAAKSACEQLCSKL
jgi:predicted RND superfamily exporter protein